MLLHVGRITSNPLDILYHCCRGHLAFWLNGENGPTGWVQASHHGVQELEGLEFPRKQLRYIYAPQFQVKYNQAFEEVVRACADIRRQGKTFITEDLIQGLVALNKLGFAHSFETWEDGRLVGGAYGVQMGSIITCDSMFHRVSNASKAAYGQTLMRLKERGFRLVDVNVVARHQVKYGEYWMPLWKVREMLRQCIGDCPALTDDRPYPGIPWQVKSRLALARTRDAIAKRAGKLLPRKSDPQTSEEQPPSAAPRAAESEEAGESTAGASGPPDHSADDAKNNAA